MSGLGVVYACLALGVLLRRTAALPEPAAAVLNRFVLVVAVPAVVLRHVHDAALSLGAAAPALAPWASLALALAVFGGLGRLRGWSPGTTGALVLTAGLANTSFVGFAMIEGLLGDRAMPTAVVLDQLGSFLAVSTAGVALAARYGGAGVRPAALLRRVVTFPPFLALCLAFATRPWPIPAAVAGPLDRLGDTMVPLALIALGLQLDVSLAALRAHGPRLALGLAFRLALVPLLAWAAVRATGAPELAGRVVVLESGMAPMVTAGILAFEFGLDRELATLMVGVGLLVSLATVPALTWLP